MMKYKINFKNFLKTKNKIENNRIKHKNIVKKGRKRKVKKMS